MGRRRTNDISTGCISKLGKLAVDAGHAGSPRDEAIDAPSTRPREDQPNEDQCVQHLGEVQEVVEPGEDTARLDAMDPISGDRDDHVSHEHSGAHLGEQPDRQAHPAREFDQRDEQCAGVWKRNVRLNHGLFHLAELARHEQLGSAGDTEKDANQDAGRSYRHPFPGAEHRQGTLDRVLHVSRLDQPAVGGDSNLSTSFGMSPIVWEIAAKRFFDYKILFASLCDGKIIAQHTNEIQVD